MALARVTTWTPGQTLTAAALNAEFDNILNNPLSLISPATGKYDWAEFEAKNFVVEGKAVDPTSTAPGRIWFNSVSSLFKGQTAGGVVTIGPSTSTSTGGATSTGVAAVGYRVNGLMGVISTNLGVFNANYYVLQSTNPYAGSVLCASTASFTINTRTAGPTANGRDTAAAHSTSPIHWYVITTGQNSTAPAGVSSTKPPTVGPALPTSYSAWGYLGASIYSTLTSGVAIFDAGAGTFNTTAANQHLMGAWTYYDKSTTHDVISSGNAT